MNKNKHAFGSKVHYMTIYILYDFFFTIYNTLFVFLKIVNDDTY